MSRWTDTDCCYCARCSTTPGGHTLQTYQTRRNHLKRNGPAPARAATGTRDQSLAPGIPLALITNHAHERPLGPQARDDANSAPIAPNLPLQSRPHSVPDPPPVTVLGLPNDAHADDQQWDEPAPGFDDDVDDSLPQAADPQIPEDTNPSVPHQPAPQLDALQDDGPFTEDEKCDYNGFKNSFISQRTPSAFREAPPVRLAYLQAVRSNIFGRLTEDAATEGLRERLDILKLADSLPAAPAPATTLATAKSRLGLNVDDYIEKRPICTVCYKHYSIPDIELLGSPRCTVPRCLGEVYRIKRQKSTTGEITERRLPAKIQPYCYWIPALRRMLLRPDFIAALWDPAKARPPPQDEFSALDDVHDGLRWRQAEVGLRREFELGSPAQDIEVVPGSRQSISCDILGLQITINLDWFGITDNRPHSTGGVYASFNNLHRGVRFLQHNVILVTTIPGPKEPSLEQLNHSIEPFVVDFKRVYSGVLMDICSRPTPRRVRNALAMTTSDVPASRKLNAKAGHSHKVHTCDQCFVTLEEVNLPSGYDIQNFRLREDFSQLGHAYQSKHATTVAARKKIVNEFGVRWSVLNEIPGYCPVLCSPTDPLPGESFKTTSMQSYGRLRLDDCPPMYEPLLLISICADGLLELGENHSLQKADQWRRFSAIMPVILWMSWRDENDNIRTDSPAVPPNAKTPPDIDCRLNKMFELVLFLSTATRLLTSRSISMYDVDRGQQLLQRYCRMALTMRIHLVINHHLSMHYAPFFKNFGPVYAWWLFAFERFNGLLEQVNLNGHAGGIMELTLMRNWVLRHRLYELLLFLPNSASAKETELLQSLAHALGTARGTLETQVAGFQSGQEIIGSKRNKFINLRSFRQIPNLYTLTLDHAIVTWPALNLGHERMIDKTPFFAEGSAKFHPFIMKDGNRYGCTSATQTDADAFAFVALQGTWIPCQFVAHLELSTPNQKPHFCSVIRRFVAGGDMPMMPWDLYAADLGYYLSYANTFHNIEIIPSSTIASPVAIVPAYSQVIKKDVWISVSFDRVSWSSTLTKSNNCLQSGVEPLDQSFNEGEDDTVL
ncbi:hypothetical protein PAXINDRAFT_182502 [Paxillus involutus ATCC 200175]|uniref:Uncharacterized protein n=1 Tax=Paxillus involutus ATCC 200175 TaxID=664439 RepID=A0A0C9SN53_PAXIN|nr:hypothetical protein PAXINDRAFT_182502 [Paxillus involutus ATCC 200175]